MKKTLVKTVIFYLKNPRWSRSKELKNKCFVWRSFRCLLFRQFCFLSNHKAFLFFLLWLNFFWFLLRSICDFSCTVLCTFLLLDLLDRCSYLHKQIYTFGRCSNFLELLSISFQYFRFHRIYLTGDFFRPRFFYTSHFVGPKFLSLVGWYFLMYFSVFQDCLSSDLRP